MRRVSTTIAAILALVALPAGALAQDNSAIDEYIESVPGAGGDNPSSDPNGGSGGGGDPLPAGASEALGAQGPAGTAAADLAQATAPTGGGDARGGVERGSGADEAGGDGRGDGLPVPDEVIRNVGGSDSDGLGIVLPIVLGATLVAAIAFVVLRRRGGPGEPTQA